MRLVRKIGLIKQGTTCCACEGLHLAFWLAGGWLATLKMAIAMCEKRRKSYKVRCTQNLQHSKQLIHKRRSYTYTEIQQRKPKDDNSVTCWAWCKGKGKESNSDVADRIEITFSSTRILFLCQLQLVAEMPPWLECLDVLVHVPGPVQKWKKMF